MASVTVLADYRARRAAAAADQRAARFERVRCAVHQLYIGVTQLDAEDCAGLRCLEVAPQDAAKATGEIAGSREKDAG